MSEDTSLHEKVGKISGLLEASIRSQEDYRTEMRLYMEKDLEAHEDLRKELHSLATNQAVEKVKLGSIVAVATVIVNQIIAGLFKN